MGLKAVHVLNAALIVALVGVLWRLERTGSFSVMVMVAMVAEGALYAMLLFKGGPVLAGVLHQKASQVFFAIAMPIPPKLLLALGAGVYEELLFRLLLIGGSAWLLRKVFLWNRAWSLLVPLVISSLLFSAVHHIGPLGEPFNQYNFVFRAVCGMLLGTVFLTRGLGVAVWTHAIYNALVMFLTAPGAPA